MQTYAERYLVRGVRLAVDACLRGNYMMHEAITNRNVDYRLEQLAILAFDKQEATRALGKYAKVIIKAVKIQVNLGTKAAAGYLRNQHVPIEIAVYALSTVRLARNWH